MNTRTAGFDQEHRTSNYFRWLSAEGVVRIILEFWRFYAAFAQKKQPECLGR